MIVHHLKPEDVGPLIQKQMAAMNASALRKLHRQVLAPTMLTMVIVGFANGEGPDGHKWKSGAAVTKLGGRFSERYSKRPSGRPVDGASIRNLDTGALANGHVVIKADHKHIKVGPGVRGKAGRARVIMEREAGYGNYAVGWDENRLRVLRAELAAYFGEIAEGKTPRYIPRSRIRTRI
jgi:hypothetical protein